MPAGVRVPGGPLPDGGCGGHGPLPAADAGVLRADVPDGGGPDCCGLQPHRPQPGPGQQPGRGSDPRHLHEAVLCPASSFGSGGDPGLGLDFGGAAGGRPHPPGPHAAGALRGPHRHRKSAQALFLRRGPGDASGGLGTSGAGNPGGSGAGPADALPAPVSGAGGRPDRGGDGALRGVFRPDSHVSLPPSPAAEGAAGAGGEAGCPAAEGGLRSPAGGGQRPAWQSSGGRQHHPHPLVWCWRPVLPGPTPWGGTGRYAGSPDGPCPRWRSCRCPPWR